MLGFILLVGFGALFVGEFVFYARRQYRYKKSGVLLDGEVVGYERHRSATSSIVFFVYNKKPMQLPVRQGFWWFYPKKGAKVKVYYTEQYTDYVLLAGRPQTFLNGFILVVGVGFLVLGTMGLLGFIPTR